ncbi:hypothetical protein BSKO_08004 [Bryopsis sp. KO-2023]|nr:hypothetical protein BSKO_08004 [Bryopsis sp. KO-2023]
MPAHEPPPSPFHEGEQWVQEKVGSRYESEQLGSRMVRNHMPDQHREFVANQILFYVATVDAHGKTWASALVGRPGFVSSPDPQHMRISPFRPMGGDAGKFEVGDWIGCLGLELHTRRRNRMNGQIIAKDADSILIRINQSFGNCPKYIQGRSLRLIENEVDKFSADGGKVVTGSALGDSQLELIRRSDTFFVGTSYLHDPPDRIKSNASGCDVSHRGGPPGFVKVSPGGSLVWADYVGNFHFNTIGNIERNPQSGGLFIDFDSGDILQLTGKAKVNYGDKTLPGAERSVGFSVDSFVHAKGVLPMTVEGGVDVSPYNPQDRGQDLGQMVKCMSVTDEADGIKTFEFKMPVDSAGFPLSYLPGQFASFDMEGLERGGKVTNRTWTVSSHPTASDRNGNFTITVKKIGLASGWLHDHMAPGKGIRFRGFGGDFSPFKCEDCPVDTPAALLVAGGIGITPLRSMLEEFRKAGTDVVLLYSTRTSAEAAFLSELEQVAGASGGKIKLVVTVTGEEEDWTGLRGRVDEAFFKEHVPDVCDREVYLCGPLGFMNSVSAYLGRIGCGLEKLYQESFAF